MYGEGVLFGLEFFIGIYELNWSGQLNIHSKAFPHSAHPPILWHWRSDLPSLFVPFFLGDGETPTAVFLVCDTWHTWLTYLPHPYVCSSLHPLQTSRPVYHFGWLHNTSIEQTSQKPKKGRKNPLSRIKKNIFSKCSSKFAPSFMGKYGQPLERLCWVYVACVATHRVC